MYSKGLQGMCRQMLKVSHLFICLFSLFDFSTSCREIYCFHSSVIPLSIHSLHVFNHDIYSTAANADVVLNLLLCSLVFTLGPRLFDSQL